MELFKMNAQEFKTVLLRAISGSHNDIEIILKLYAPLIYRNSCLNGTLDEDLQQYILMHIIKNISKFKI